MIHKTINSVCSPDENFTNLAYPNLDNGLSKNVTKKYEKFYLQKNARVLFSGKKIVKKGITTTTPYKISTLN